jgi:metallophosphoesterase (TIGR00282 family)
MRILYLAEIVGKAGIWCVKSALADLKREEKPDVVVANANGATGSYGLGKQHAGYLRKLGIDVITGGDCVFYKKDLVEGFEQTPYVIRPANFPPESPGRGWRLQQTQKGKLAVVSLIGRALFPRVHGDNPFEALAAIASRLSKETPFVLVDFHAVATAEKQAFFWHSDGKVSAVVGSHGRVQTSDECVLPQGTACITDAGRTGSLDSVGGTDPAPRIAEYRSRLPEWSRDAWANLRVQGAVIDLGPDGKARGIRRFSVPCPEPSGAEQKET